MNSPPETRNPKLETLSLFFGDASNAVARVYARLEGDAETIAGLTLTGLVTGPFCEFARTLPAHVPLVDSGPGESLLAAAVVPDPCFWTPELPFVYQVQVELRRGKQVVETIERPFGLRRLGARGRDLYLDGKRFVVRGIARDEPVSAAQLAELHDTNSALWIKRPSDALCDEAGRSGVLLLAELPGDLRELRAEIARLARWPAVGVAILEAAVPVNAEVHSAAPNLLLAQRIPAGEPVQSASWAQLVLCEADDLQEFRKQAASFDVPVLATRRGDKPASRDDCDGLQADLASLGDFAGYLVTRTAGR